MQWRDMTAAELATRPEAKLGGALLAIDITAVLLCAVVLAGLIVAQNEFRAMASALPSSPCGRGPSSS